MTEPETDRPLRGRRLSWAEFYRLRPDLMPANDNRPSVITSHSNNDLAEKKVERV